MEGVTHVLSLCSSPSPHDTEHVLQADQSFHTAITKTVCMYYVMKQSIVRVTLTFHILMFTGSIRIVIVVRLPGHASNTHDVSSVLRPSQSRPP